MQGVVPWSAHQVDEACKGEKMSEIAVMASLVLIIGLLGFIAVMIWGIGEKISEHEEKK